MENLLPSIHELLGSTDWATRKAAADALSALALHSSNFITDGGASTFAVLEACRFDKVVFCFHLSFMKHLTCPVPVIVCVCVSYQHIEEFR